MQQGFQQQKKNSAADATFFNQENITTSSILMHRKHRLNIMVHPKHQTGSWVWNQQMKNELGALNIAATEIAAVGSNKPKVSNLAATNQKFRTWLQQTFDMNVYYSFGSKIPAKTYRTGRKTLLTLTSNVLTSKLSFFWFLSTALQVPAANFAASIYCHLACLSMII